MRSSNPGEGQVRLLITVAGNPALTTPDSGRLEKALESLEFMVSVDPYLNETSLHADVVLPAPSALERSHYDLAFTGLSVRDFSAYSPQVFEGAGMPEFEILVRLTGDRARDGCRSRPGPAGRGLVDGGRARGGLRSGVGRGRP